MLTNEKERPVFLCGFMGCGKSTIGKELANILGFSFLDMDDYIEKRQDMTIPQMFDELGEEFFRAAETVAVGELSRRKGTVIACGGGAMLREINSAIANKSGRVVYIDIDFESCYQRISGDSNRPIVMKNTKEQLNEIYNSRAPLYNKHSDFSVDGNGTPKEIAERIAAAIDTSEV